MRDHTKNMASAKEGLANISQFQINGRPVTKLKVDELKQALIARGLEKSGLKKELQERLCKALAKEQSNTEETIDEKPGVNSDETSSQEVSSTTADIKEMPSAVEATEMPSVAEKNVVQSVIETEEMPSVVETKESDGHGEEQVTEDKESSTTSEENKVEKNHEEKTDEKEVREADTTGNKIETEEVEDGEITGQQDDKKDIQKSAVPEKRRRISLTRQTGSNPPTPGTRKRKWSSNKAKSSVVISTDSLKELIPGVQLASTPALEAVMELDDDKDDEEEGKDEKQQEEKKQENEEISSNKKDEKSPYKKRIVQVANAKTVKLGEALNEAESDHQNDVGITESIQPSAEAPAGTGNRDDNHSSPTPPSPETATPVKREVSPPCNPPSCALHVSNLVRPFTQKQLMQYLSQFGAVTEEGFWMNKIKSHCYVMYPSVDEATSARESLHGERWPATSPRTLRVDFAENAKMLEDTDGALGEKIEEQAEEKEEVDDGKERSRSREKSSRKHKEKQEEKKNDQPTAANLLDKLFRKTTAVPCIYWLPLTNEQVVMKAKEREERRRQRQLAMEEEKKAGVQKPREEPRKALQEKPREMERPKPREVTRDQERRPLRNNRESSPSPRQRPDRRPSPVKRRSRSPPLRRGADRRR